MVKISSVNQIIVQVEHLNYSNFVFEMFPQLKSPQSADGYLIFLKCPVLLLLLPQLLYLSMLSMSPYGYMWLRYSNNRYFNNKLLYLILLSLEWPNFELT